jgi:hypothetical protein
MQSTLHDPVHFLADTELFCFEGKLLESESSTTLYIESMNVADS